jgi:GPH family glycoside/pentoside/hexuronide:cation symporter
VQSDVIDYDEYETGERKEGAYFAAWNFVFKCSFGVTLFLTGWVLTLSGFQPNVEQTETAKLALLSLYALYPLVCYLIGTVIFMRFGLDEKEHTRIRQELDRRAAEAGQS